MEIEISDLSKQKLTALVVTGGILLIVALALLGRAVTPVIGGAPALLSPARWQAYGLASQARDEIRRLRNDMTELHELLQASYPDPVAALLFAQRIKADHNEVRGTGVTLPARRALILAAEVAALSASGAEPRTKAVEAYNAALQHMQRLEAMPVAGSLSDPGSTPHLPLVATPAAQP
jgi:hypothetical protein